MPAPLSRFCHNIVIQKDAVLTGPLLVISHYTGLLVFCHPLEGFAHILTEAVNITF